MIVGLETGWLSASATGPNVFSVDLTFEFPREPVHATTAISASTVGVFEHVPGSVATYFREYGYFVATDSVKVVDIPPDPMNNCLFIDECAFVRCRLAVRQAMAYSQVAIFRYPKRRAPAPRTRVSALTRTVRDFDVTDGSGRIVGRHRVLTLARKSRLDVDDIVGRAAAEAAGFHGVDVGRMTVAEAPSEAGHLQDEERLRDVF